MKGGLFFMILGIFLAIIYNILIFFTPWKGVIIEASAYLSAMIIMGILIFIGYLLATTPENKPVSVEDKVKEMLEENNK
jgi:predicted DNA-binding transcriptional regulator